MNYNQLKLLSDLQLGQHQKEPCITLTWLWKKEI